MFIDQPVKEFLEKVASGEPVPGGGSVAALCGALSAVLMEMVGRLTVCKSRDQALDAKMSSLMETAARLRLHLTEDMDRDSDAFTAVMEAYGMAKGTDEEKKARQAAIQSALKDAVRVPLSVAEIGVRLLDLAEIAVEEGNQSAVTDAAVAALMARSAVLGALYNVRINLASVKDAGFRAELTREAERLEQKAVAKEKEILSIVSSIMRQV
jgi:formiminotetrahydrofolate cyclodeaminase